LFGGGGRRARCWVKCGRVIREMHAAPPIARRRSKERWLQLNWTRQKKTRVRRRNEAVHTTYIRTLCSPAAETDTACAESQRCPSCARITASTNCSGKFPEQNVRARTPRCKKNIRCSSRLRDSACFNCTILCRDAAEKKKKTNLGECASEERSSAFGLAGI
jgi:hypothetical protein